MPAAIYRSGATFVPVCPTCSACGRQPELVTTREQPIVPPRSAANSSKLPKPSGPPTPRPPETITFASLSVTPPLLSPASRLNIFTTESAGSSAGSNCASVAGAPLTDSGSVEKLSTVATKSSA